MFTTIDDCEQLNHEIEYFDDTIGELVTWIKIPTLSENEDTEFYMYYGNPNCDEQESSENVWDTNYVMVQHLEETSGEHIDSTGLDNNGINHGSTQDASGKIDGANSFDGQDDYIEVSHSDSLNIADAITIEGWFSLSTLNQYNPLIRKGESSHWDVNEDGIAGDGDLDILTANWHEWGYPTPYPRYDLDVDGDVDIHDVTGLMPHYGETSHLWFVQIADNNGDGDNRMMFSLTGTSNPQISSEKIFTDSDLNAWHHFAAIYDGSKSYLYIDGVLDSWVDNTGNIDTTNMPLKIGSDTDRYYMDGSIDEICISSSARSPEWISTSFNNQNSPTEFINVGEEDTL